MRAAHPRAVIVAGGTFTGILVRQGLLAPEDWLSLQHVEELRGIDTDDHLVAGAMVTHRRLELHPAVAAGWDGVRQVFSVVASPRVRNQATIGGVLGDADYASDPPAMLVALGAWATVASVRGSRDVPVADLIVDHYQTSLDGDELITHLHIPAGHQASVYRKLRTRSAEDRPCVSVAAVIGASGEMRAAVGAVTGRPCWLPEACASWIPGDSGSNRAVADAYAGAIEPISDVRGSAEYRRHAIRVEVRRALENLAR